MELSSRVRGPGRACALAVACAISVARAIAQESTDAPAAPEEVAAPPPELASTVAPADARPPAAAEPALPELPEIVVVGRRPRGEVERDPTASATVIEADRFAGEAKGVAELVATAPGVAVNEYGGLGHLSTISIRGSTADGVLVLLDGIPLNTAFGGGVDLSTIPHAWIERIEVVRGVEGAIYRAGALGGVVNVVTRRAAMPGGSAELTAGSFETFAAAVDRALALGRTSIRIAAGADATGGAFPYQWDPTPDDADRSFLSATRQNNGAARASGLVAIRTPLGNATLDALAHVTAARRDLAGWPYKLTPYDRQDDGRALVSARISGAAPGRALALAGGVTGRFDLLDTRIDGATTNQRGGAAGIDGEARWGHGPGLLRIAVEAKEEVLDQTTLGERRARTDLAARASEDVTLGARGRVSPAIRIDRVGNFEGISAKLGGSLRVAGPLSVRASAGRSFRAPSFAELFLRQGIVAPNPNLAPEEGIGGDAALVLEAGPVFASAGGHTTLYRDLITYQPVSFGQLKPFNTGKALMRGIELEAASAPIRPLLGLAFSASYTLLASEILRGPEGTLGNWVPRRARHRLFARMSSAPGRAGLHLEAHYVGRQYADPRNLAEIRSALVWNAGASLLLSCAHAVRLHVELRNVLDDRTLQDALANPLPGRTVLVTVRAGSTASKGTP